MKYEKKVAITFKNNNAKLTAQKTHKISILKYSLKRGVSSKLRQEVFVRFFSAYECEKYGKIKSFKRNFPESSPPCRLVIFNS